MGFLHRDQRRVNVLLSRAKHKLVFVMKKVKHSHWKWDLEVPIYVILWQKKTKNFRD